MKFLKITLAFVLPVLITVLVFICFNKAEDQNVTVTDMKIEEADRKLDALEKWINSKKAFLNDEFFKNLKIRHDDKELKFEDLDPSKKLVFKIMLFSKAKRDLENSTFVQDIDSENKIKINQLIESVDINIKKQKQNLYNIYGSKLHPQDKIFLENIDVHLFK